MNTEFSTINWVHPDPNDDGRRAMERIGVGIGDEFLIAGIAGWARPEPEKLGLVWWQDGHLVVHTVHRYRLHGWYQPQYGFSDKGCVIVSEAGSTVNVVMGQLRTGSTIGDPKLKWPIAKAPAWECGGPPAYERETKNLVQPHLHNTSAAKSASLSGE